MVESKPWDGRTERRREAISVPYPLVGVFVTIALQTIAGVWWASGMNTSMAFLKSGQNEVSQTIAAAAANRYTSIDASRDWAVNDRRVDSMEAAIISNRKDIVQLQIKTGTSKGGEDGAN